jgi:hypothetical protein
VQRRTHPQGEVGPEANKRTSELRERLLAWFGSNGRSFPWRDPDRSAYEILVAEILLQRAGRREFPALLWLIDEWAMLRKDCPAMAEALTQAFSVWRKLGLRTGVSSVALETRELGISKSAVSTLALFCGNENLARTWGLSGIKPQLDSLYRSDKGYRLITSQHLQRQAEVLVLPNVSADLFQRVIEQRRPDLIQRVLDTYTGLPLRVESAGAPGTGIDRTALPCRGAQNIDP